MPEIQIRPVKLEDNDQIKLVEHEYQTDHAWQMERNIDAGSISIHFREIRLPRIIRIECPHSLETGGEEWFQKMKGLSAFVKDELVGFIYINLDQETRTARVMDLAVKKKFRRIGIASALLYSAQEFASKNDIKRIILEIQSKNFPAIRMAQKLGYEFCGYNDHYNATQDIVLFFSHYTR